VTTDRIENVDTPSPAQNYDDALRWIIPSRTNPHESYVVELGDAPGYSVCQCMHFVGKLGPLLARGVTPEDAVARGMVRLKKNQCAEDSLKCWHIREAEKRLARATIRAIVKARKLTNENKKHASPPRRTTQTKDAPPPRFRPARE